MTENLNNKLCVRGDQQTGLQRTRGILPQWNSIFFIRDFFSICRDYIFNKCKNYNLLV